MNINDKIVVIDDIKMDEKFKIYYPIIPKKGEIYVIRDVMEFDVKNCPTKILYLTGIYSKNNEVGKEMGWNSVDFQLLKDYKNKPKFGGEYDWMDKNE